MNTQNKNPVNFTLNFTSTAQLGSIFLFLYNSQTLAVRFFSNSRGMQPISLHSGFILIKGKPKKNPGDFSKSMKFCGISFASTK